MWPSKRKKAREGDVRMRFCVIGAGSGGRACAAYISSKGHQVSLYNRSYMRIRSIKKKGGIEAKGALNGFFRLGLVTQDLNMAVKNADVIMIVTPASAHKELAEKIAPVLSNNQIIVLNPGRTFGSVEVKRIIENKRKDIFLIVGETQTLLFTARELPENGVNIIKIKDSVSFSSFPGQHIYKASDRLMDIFPQLDPTDNYLEVTLNNIGMLLHPAISLLNAGMIDFGKNFKFYREGATSRVCKVLEWVEFEINEIFKKLGLQQFRYYKWARKAYGVEAISTFEALQKIEAYSDINAPDNLITRYFTEDVPTGLVPITSLGSFLNIPTPTIHSIIQLSSILCNVDFRQIGRTIEKLELSEFLLNHLRKLKIVEEELKGYYTVKRILSKPRSFKICSHCETLNSFDKKSCWLCSLKDFRALEEEDLIKYIDKKEKTLIRA